MELPLTFVSRNYQPDKVIETDKITLIEHMMHGLQHKCSEDFVAGMSHEASIELVCLTDLSPRQVTLAPSGSDSIIIPMAFGTYRGQARSRYEACKKRIEGGWTSADETQRWTRLFEGLPPLPEKYRGKGQYERLYKHAVALGYFWDTAISCVGARQRRNR